MVNNKGNIGWRLCLPIFPYFFYSSPIPFIVSLLYILYVSYKERGNAWDFVTNSPNVVSPNRNPPMSL